MIQQFLSLLRGNFAKNQKLGQLESSEIISTTLADAFNEKILPLSEVYENERLKRLRKSSLRLRVSLIAFCLICVSSVVLAMLGSFINPLIIIVVLLLSLGWILSPLLAFKSKIKQNIYPTLFDCFENLNYQPEGTLDFQALMPSGIIPHHDECSSEDYISGCYKGVKIELCESILMCGKKNDSPLKKSYVACGLYVLLTMNKSFSGITQIFPVKDDFYTKLQGTRQNNEHLEAVILEDVQFEKKYSVYGTDQVESRYLLTPSFIERYIELAEHFGGKPIKASFFEQKLLLEIDFANQYYFEPTTIFKPVDFRDDVYKLVKNIRQIYAIVDTLKINENIGL